MRTSRCPFCWISGSFPGKKRFFLQKMKHGCVSDNPLIAVAPHSALIFSPGHSHTFFGVRT